jgi:large subunit ribosomal protein L7/L12
MAGTLTKEEILDGIAEFSVIQLSELLKDFEERFGVTAAAPVAVAAAPPRRPAADAGGGEEEKVGVRRHPDRGRRQEDPGDQGSPCPHQPGPQGGQGPGRGGPKPVLEKANKEDAEKAKAALEAPEPPSRSSSPGPGRAGHPPGLGPGSLTCGGGHP